MKKAICLVLTFIIMCAMAIPAFAAYTYEGDGFKLVTDVEADIWDDDSIDEGFYYLGFKELAAEIEIQISDVSEYMNNSADLFDVESISSCKELYEIYKEGWTGSEAAEDDECEYEIITLDGIPAFVTSDNLVGFIHIDIWSDNTFYEIEIEATDEEAAEALYDMVSNGFEITDSVTWYESDEADADDISDKADTDDKAETEDEKEDKEDEDDSEDKDVESENGGEKNDNTLIIVIGVVAVAAIAAVVVVMLKKKQ